MNFKAGIIDKSVTIKTRLFGTLSDIHYLIAHMDTLK